MAVLAPSAAAQSREWDTAAASYGRGVHAYFAGRYGDAEAGLSRALELNPDDPRLFYFRALTLMRLGRSDEACSDLEVGAALEAKRPNRYGIGSALQRVQGGDRLVLESYRRKARAGDLTQQRLGHAPSQTRASDESQVLYQPVIVPLDGFLQPGTPPALTAEELSRRAASAESRDAPRLPPQTPGSTSPSSETNPFQDDAAAAPAQPAPSARSAEAPTEPAEEAGLGDSGVESDKGDEGVDGDEETSTPGPQSPASESTESEDDPFQDFQ